MLQRTTLAVFVRLALLLACAQAAAAPLTVVDTLGDGVVALDGRWAFHAGDDPSWSAVAFDDSRWERRAPGVPWDLQGAWARDGYGWYRMEIHVGPTRPASALLSVWIPSVGDAYEVYWNGVRVGGSGSLPPSAKWIADSSSVIRLGEARDGVLAIRVWRAPFLSIGWNDYGGLRSAPRIGLSHEVMLHVENQRNVAFRSDFSYLILLPLYTLAAGLSLLAWFSNRGKIAYLCLSIFSVSMIAMLVASSPLGWEAPLPWLLAVNRAGIGIRDVALWIMLLWLLDLRRSRWLVRTTRVASVWILSVVAVYLVVLLVLWPSQWAHVAQEIELPLAGLYAVPGLLSLVIVAVAVLRGKRLTLSNWILAVATAATQLLVVARNVSIVGLRFTYSSAIAYLLKPLAVVHGIAIHKHTATDTLVLAALVYAFYWDSVEQRRRHALLEREFANARELQQVLIPEALPGVPGYALTSAYRPALEVGGDFFQIIPLEAGSTLVVLGDVSGKGLKAAMAVSLILGALRALAEEYSSPAELLDVLNQRLCGRLQGGFATCIALRLEANGECRLASAGHPAPLLNDGEVDLAGALPLGLMPRTAYAEQTLNLEADDQLSLYTDGLLEARSPAGELFGFERVRAIFANGLNAEQAVESAVAFGQDDDITVLILTAQG
jgi:hypothetical protein